VRQRLAISGTVALVTGAADGIGLAVARQLVDRGATVAAVDVDAAGLEAAVAGLGGSSRAFPADVSDRAAMEHVVADVCKAFGRLDIVVANAGVTPLPGTLRTADPADFDRVFNINVRGVLNTVVPAIDPLIAQGGHAVVVASAAAFTPTPGGAAYGASKAAVESLGRVLRLELARHDVSVQVACFGIVDSEMTRASIDRDPVGRALEQLLPRPLRRRISTDQAAASLVGGIVRRAPRTMAPRTWIPAAWLRGIAGPAADSLAARNPKLHKLISDIDNEEPRDT
jgi:NAD(P)-dependent dehydrogenase (short-subunit alcohol dehydrogenase family)